jgi:hypothetical protein
MSLGGIGFAIRHRSEQLYKVELDRRAMEHIPEALRHVSRQVFEDEHDERHHLYDASYAVAKALQESQGSSARKIAVELTLNELTHAPEALRHVAHEVFDNDEDDREYQIQQLLYGAAKAIKDVYEANAPSSGPRR